MTSCKIQTCAPDHSVLSPILEHERLLICSFDEELSIEFGVVVFADGDSGLEGLVFEGGPHKPVEQDVRDSHFRHKT